MLSVWLSMCGVFISLCVFQFQDELTAQEQDEEGHEEEEEREEEAPALGKPAFSTPPDIPLVYPHTCARHIHTVLLLFLLRCHLHKYTLLQEVLGSIEFHFSNHIFNCVD